MDVLTRYNGVFAYCPEAQSLMGVGHVSRHHVRTKRASQRSGEVSFQLAECIMSFHSPS